MLFDIVKRFLASSDPPAWLTGLGGLLDQMRLTTGLALVFSFVLALAVGGLCCGSHRVFSRERICVFGFIPAHGIF